MFFRVRVGFGFKKFFSGRVRVKIFLFAGLWSGCRLSSLKFFTVTKKPPYILFQSPRSLLHCLLTFKFFVYALLNFCCIL